MNNYILRSNSGYTFIELLVALTILGLMMPPILMMLSGSFLSINHAGNHTRAVNLCRQQMEMVKAMGYDYALELYSTEDTDPILTEDNIKDYPGFKRTTRVRSHNLTCTSIFGLEAKLLLVEITVTWNDGKNERKETLTGLLSDR